MDISYGGENGFNQAIELSADCLANVKFVQEKKLIGGCSAISWLYTSDHLLSGRFFDEISQDSGKVCFGVDDTLKSLEMGAVETLICWENLDIQRYLLRNPTTGEEKIIYLRGNQQADKGNFTDKEVIVTLRSSHLLLGHTIPEYMCPLNGRKVGCSGNSSSTRSLSFCTGPYVLDGYEPT